MTNGLGSISVLAVDGETGSWNKVAAGPRVNVFRRKEAKERKGYTEYFYHNDTKTQSDLKIGTKEGAEENEVIG